MKAKKRRVGLSRRLSANSLRIGWHIRRRRAAGNVVAYGDEVIAERLGDLPLKKRDGHPKPRAQLDGVGESYCGRSWGRAAGQPLHAPHALVVREVADPTHSLHGHVAVREGGEDIRPREHVPLHGQRRAGAAGGGVTGLLVRVRVMARARARARARV